MRYLLDTNICIFIIKQKPSTVLKKFETLLPGDIGISSVTLAELFYGVEKSKQKEKNFFALSNFILPLEVVDFDAQAAAFYGSIRSSLETLGKTIGSLDLMIAAHAKSRGLIIVTNNKKEFSRVDGLVVEDWV